MYWYYIMLEYIQMKLPRKLRVVILTKPEIHEEHDIGLY